MLHHIANGLLLDSLRKCIFCLSMFHFKTCFEKKNSIFANHKIMKEVVYHQWIIVYYSKYRVTGNQRLMTSLITKNVSTQNAQRHLVEIIFSL